MRRRRDTLVAAAIVLPALLLGPPPASAEEPCPQQPTVTALVGGGPVYESIAFDRSGRLFFSGGGQVLMIPRLGADPKLIADGIDGTGGIVARRDGKLLVGFGNTIDGAGDGSAQPDAGMLRIDPARGGSTASKVWVEGLSMANGVVRGPGKTLYASNDIAGGIDKVTRRRTVELGWSSLASPNGLEIDPSNRRFLYAAQTFQPAAIEKIELADPTNSTAWYTAPPADSGAGFDGTWMGRSGSLYVAANGAGQVWRVDGPGAACVLASRDPFPSGPSDLAFGRGRHGFARSSLFVTTFGGELLELRGAR